MSKPEAPSRTGRLFLFAIGGTLGFLVDATVLACLSSLGVNLYGGRVLSFLCAVFATWRFNRRRTFGERRRENGQLLEALRYLAAMSLGGAANYLGFVLLLEHWRLAGEWPVVAVAAGCLLGMVVNYSTSSRWVFRKRN
ncbi:GtrA family protein [Pseudomonas jinjuensis]|uniref:Flippase GtrA (Transmembrane translocase of bactoprenol-linked glucose) n=1 Tax=Pseudomonas jinjuensis TaxID=198616 RepID=A0A1H0MQV0_9PSED|nr:GtrA family protein [Pseudomonas jinjuensis]SDO82813.1 Putative flippase GtrA (transmembrane translocase of bactoprenol-linked glucose) [Pseudomonas jinjuensis]